MVDTATKYQVASLLKSERGPDLIKGLERCWIKHFGIPTKLVTDEGRGWCGTEFSEWTTDFGVQHEVAPGEAHTRLSAVERRHSVLRKAAEIFMTDRNLDNTTGVRMALTYVLPQINSSTTVAGFSPMQWVLGKQVTLPGELCGERLSPGQLDGYLDARGYLYFFILLSKFITMVISSISLVITSITYGYRSYNSTNLYKLFILLSNYCYRLFFLLIGIKKLFFY